MQKFYQRLKENQKERARCAFLVLYFGVLAVLGTCAAPFLRLGLQYLLYKLAAFAAGTVSSPALVKLVDRLGSAFGLILGMVGSCALLLTVAVRMPKLADNVRSVARRGRLDKVENRAGKEKFVHG